MDISKLKVWKWVLLILGGTLFFLLVYSFGQISPYVSKIWWIKSLISIVSGLVILLVYYAARKLIEKKRPSDLCNKNWAKDTAKGFLTGFLFMGITTLAIAIAGCYKVDSIGADWKNIIVYLMFFFIVACGEEVVFRGVIFRMIKERFNIWAALIVSALIFGFVHISNGGATVWSSIAIAIEAGLLLGAAYLYSESLWMPIGIHWAWNFAEGNIFGFSVSGNEEMVSLLKPAINGPDIITGGAFGAEASILCVILGTLMTVYFLYLFKKKNKSARSETQS